MNSRNIHFETVVEAPYAELFENSGVIDDSTGEELTNWQVAEAIARQNGAYEVFVSMNGHLSTEAKQHNTQVTRSGVGEYVFALIAKHVTD